MQAGKSTHTSQDRPYHHGDLKRVVIETAMTMLREGKGWQFTLREVARRAGVSHAAPYKHFSDKAALLAELAMIGFDQLRAALAAARTRASMPVRDQLFAAGQAYVQFGATNPALYRLMFSAEVGAAGAVLLGERALAAFGVLIDILERGQVEGCFRKRPLRGQAAACWAQVHGLTMLTIDGLLLPAKVGSDASPAALITLLEGLEVHGSQ